MNIIDYHRSINFFRGIDILFIFICKHISVKFYEVNKRATKIWHFFTIWWGLRILAPVNFVWKHDKKSPPNSDDLCLKGSS